MGFLSNLFDPGKKYRDASAGYARDAQFTGGNFAGPGGLSGGINFDSSGRGTINTGLGSFSPLLGQVQGLSNFGFGLAQQGLPPELLALAQQSMGQMGPVNLDRYSNFGGARALEQLMGSSLATATADPFALGEQTTDRFRQLSQRSNQNLVNTTFDRLFASGGLSNQVTRDTVAGDLARQLDEQDLRFQQAGLEAGRGLQQDATGRLMAGFGGLEQFGSRLFGEGFQQAGLNAQLGQSAFGIGAELQNLRLAQMMAGSQIGTTGLQSGMQLSQLPLSFLAANLQAQGLKSDAALGASGINARMSESASSPLLGAISAIGQFGSAIGGFGGFGSLLGGVGGMFGLGGGGGGGFTGLSSGMGLGGFGGGLNIDHLLQGIGSGQ